MDAYKHVAIEFMLLRRPAGGSYRLEMFDGHRFQTDAEYSQIVRLFEGHEDEPEEEIVFDGRISRADIDAFLLHDATAT